MGKSKVRLHDKASVEIFNNFSENSFWNRNVFLEMLMITFSALQTTVFYGIGGGCVGARVVALLFISLFLTVCACWLWRYLHPSTTEVYMPEGRVPISVRLVQRSCGRRPTDHCSCSHDVCREIYCSEGVGREGSVGWWSGRDLRQQLMACVVVYRRIAGLLFNWESVLLWLN